MNYAIEIDNLSKRYRRAMAVDGLTLKVPQGKIYGFLGRNGAGKTTTIRMIMGLVKPDQGAIKILGRDARKDRKWVARQIGAIIETPGFYENLTAEENLQIAAMLYGVDRKRINNVLATVGLADTGRKRVGDFSLGMKQRLGIANTLIHSPRILILDEPTNGLDPAGIRDMRLFLRDLSEKNGLTILVSSHLLSEIQQVADLVGIIDQGRLLEETDIGALGAQGQSHVAIEADQPEAVTRLVKQMGLDFERDHDQIRVYCHKPANAELLKMLVAQGINIYHYASVSMTLEDRFLKLTGAAAN